MVTKLKKIPRRTKIVFFAWLLSGCILAGIAGMSLSYLWNAYYFYNSMGHMFRLLLGGLAGIAVLIYLVFLFYRPSSWKNMTPLSLDHIHLELLAALTGFTGFLWLHSLYICMRDSLLFNYFFIGPGAVPIVSVLFFLPLALLFLGECLLLIRRFLLGSAKQTSLLYGMAEKWREATPLEKRLARKNLWPFLFILAGVGCCIW